VNKIENHNCAGICNERFCDNLETNFVILDIHGMELVVGFCENHATIFDDKISEETKRRVNG